MSIYRNILIIRLSSLGDVLLTMPAVKALKSFSPSASVTWVVEGGVGELLAHQGFVDRVIEFPRRTVSGALRGGRFFSAARTMGAFLGKLRERDYDLVLDFHGILKSACLARSARGTRRIGFDRTFAKEGSWIAYDEKVEGKEKRLHKVERNMLIASHLGAPDFPDVDLEAPPAARSYIEKFFSDAGLSGPVIAVNPFCSKGSAFKRWDLSAYGELVRRVRDETGAHVLILWGPDEKEEAIRLNDMSGGAAVLACPTTVSQLYALLKRTDLYVGGDTGGMHLAAFAGMPIVAIFGPTDHLVNGPYGKGHRVIRKEMVCSPCRDKSCRDRSCLRSITVDEVFMEVNAAWMTVRGC